jgi:hypothetical protein
MDLFRSMDAVSIEKNNHENYRGGTRRLAPDGGSVFRQLLNANREEAADCDVAVHL